jgi:hypothetical protein
MRFCLPSRFSPVSVCVTQILEGRTSSYTDFPPTPSHTHPPTLISICITHLSRLWADSPTYLWAIQPTCREITDFKKAGSQRDKKEREIRLNILRSDKILEGGNAKNQRDIWLNIMLDNVSEHLSYFFLLVSFSCGHTSNILSTRTE